MYKMLKGAHAQREISYRSLKQFQIFIPCHIWRRKKKKKSKTVVYRIKYLCAINACLGIHETNTFEALLNDHFSVNKTFYCQLQTY